MGKQLTMCGLDPDGFGDLPEDPICEHCGREHNTAGRYCSAECAQRSRHDADECKLIEYCEPCDRQSDRDDCQLYWDCSLVAANADAARVCPEGCKRYARDDEPTFTVLRSNAVMVMR